MTWAYLAELGPGGQLDWGGGPSGGIPATGNILPDLNDSDMWMTIIACVREGKYEGRHVDWGASAIKVNGPELLAVLARCYGDLSAKDPNSLIGRYIGFAKELGEDRILAFVAAEL
jgi:hypothetical protein